MAPATKAARERGRAIETPPTGEATFCRPPPPPLLESEDSVAAGSGFTATKDVAVTSTTSPLEAVDVKVERTSLKLVVRGEGPVVVGVCRVFAANQLAIVSKARE